MASFIARHCISAYVIHQTDIGPRYLLIRRCGKYLPGTWQMVSGGIEPGETAAEAALREIQEETGLIPSALYSADAVETFYMHSEDKIALVPVFAAFVQNTAVRLSPQEHDAHEWLTFEEARDRLVWAEQKRVITQIHNSFIQNLPNSLLLIKNAEPSPKMKPIISRTGVYGIVLKDEKILLVKQQKGPHSGKWDLPGGGIEVKETIEDALCREFLEEIGMSFKNMRFFKNFTATTEEIDEQGRPYLFHQVGLVYLIDGLTSVQKAEMEHAWIDMEQLRSEPISPFVREVLLTAMQGKKNTSHFLSY